MACGKTKGMNGSSSPYRSGGGSSSDSIWETMAAVTMVIIGSFSFLGGAVTAFFLADILEMRGDISSSESILQVVVGGPSGGPS